MTIISQNTVWASGQTISLTEKVQISSGVTLQIEEGCIVNGNGFEIQTFGNLSASGAPDNKIEFNNVRLTFTGNSTQPGRIDISHVVWSGGAFLPATGNASYGSFTVSNSIISGLETAYIWYPTSSSGLYNNIFSNTGAFYVLTSTGGLEVVGNVFAGTPSLGWGAEAWISVFAAYGRSVLVSGNVFPAGVPSVSLGINYTNARADAVGNYWGTNSPVEIAAMILDQSDDLNRSSIVPYEPFLTAYPDSVPNFFGTSNSDRLNGNSLHNMLLGLYGNDTLIGAGSADWLDGGAGIDTADYSGAISSITADLEFGFSSGADGTDRLIGIENLLGSTHADQLTGDFTANMLDGSGGNDTLIGGTGNDTLEGGDGTDTVTYNSPMAGFAFGSATSGDITVTDTVTVTGGNDGADTLREIERILFSDGVVTLRQFSETRVNTTTTGDQTGPAVTALADGGYVVTWESGDGSGYGVYAQRYGADGSAIGAETRINTTTANDQYQSAITALTDGGYVVAWTSVDGSGYGGVYAQRYDASGLAVGAEARHITDLYWLPDQGTPAITGLADGGYVVTWTNSGQGYDWILSQRYSPGGAAVGSPNYVDDGSPYPRVNHAITALADGGYVVTWSANYSYFNDGSLDEIFVRRFSASGIAVGAEARTNTTAAGNQGSPAIAGLEDGGYVVTWTSDSDIYAQRYAASGAAVGPETRINTTTADFQSNPAITALADGGYVVMWEGVDDSGYGVYAQRYGADGSVVGAETRINTTTANGQGTPAVTALPDGGYVVAWMSDNQDGSGYGVYAQRFDASGGTVKLTGDSAANTVTWSANTSIAIDGSGGSDTLTGGDGSDFLKGGLGNDSLSGGPGTDTLVGGAGNDTYIVDSASDRITESTNEGTDLVRASVSYTLADNVENLALSAGPSSSGTGNALANRITGNAGANTLDGGAGADTLIGGAGNDVYYVDSTSDTVTENAGAGADTVWARLNHTLAENVENLRLTGSAVSGTGNSSHNSISGTEAANTLRGGLGNDTLNGGAGADTLIGGTGNDTYVVDVIDDVVTEAAAAGLDLVQSSLDWTLSLNVEQLLLLDGAVSGTGNAQNNTLTGNALSNVLNGLEGNDTLVGAGAGDTLIGGTGNDTYLANLDDQLIEAAGEGTDTVKSNIAWTLGAELENLSLGGPGNIGGTGNDLGNLIRGNDGNNRLQGLGGADTLIGGLGADLLDGGLQNDNLTGGVGADRLVGGDGNDTLIGAEDNDTLTGGVGADAFVFQSALGATNLDTVVDFAAGVDKLRLDDDVFAAFTVGVALTASQFVSGAGITAAQTTDQRIAYNTTTGALYYDADGLNGEAAVQFAVLGSTTHPALSAGDFVIVG